MDREKLNLLTEGERFIVEWQYRMQGGFDESLARTLGIADGRNFAKLRKGFPEKAQAFWDYQNTKGWWEKVREKVGL